MSSAELVELVKQMQEQMKYMSAKMDAYTETMQLQKEEILYLKSKTNNSSSSTGSEVTTSGIDKELQKQMVRDSIETAKIAKDAVPKLLIASPGNFADWRERLQEVLKLKPYRGVAKFLQDVGLKPVTGIVKVEPTTESKTTPSLTAESIPEETFENFFAFLTSKLTDEFRPKIKEANRCAKASDQLKYLWAAIQQNFVLNTATVRGAKTDEWGELRQHPEETFDNYVTRVGELRMTINTMFSPIISHEKIDDDDMLTKIKKLNPYYQQMMGQTIDSMKNQRESYSLQEYITNLSTVEKEYEITHPAERTERVNMARTTTPLPIQSVTNFRATINSAQAKQEWLCNNWNGEPGSCKYGQNCRFKHTNDKAVRRAHLKKVQEWQAAQKAKADESKKRKNEDKSAKKAAAQASNAAAQASNGVTAKDYAEIARAMVVAMKDLGTPSKSVSWPDADKGKQIEERREKEGRGREREKKEEREKEKNGKVELERKKQRKEKKRRGK